jgi:hypothetical protein
LIISVKIAKVVGRLATSTFQILHDLDDFKENRNLEIPGRDHPSSVPSDRIFAAKGVGLTSGRTSRPRLGKKQLAGDPAPPPDYTHDARLRAIKKSLYTID